MNYYKSAISVISLFCLLFFSTISIAQNKILDQEITIAFNDLSIKESLQKLEQQTGLATAFNEKELKDQKYTLAFEKELLKEVLDAILTNDDLSYKVIGNTITIFRNEIPKSKPVRKTKPVAQKKFTISGYIMDAESKETLIGANAFITEIKKGTSTNEYGFYSMTLPQGNYEITFSYIGYQTIIKEVNLIQDMEFSANLSIENHLEEVIVTAENMEQRHMDAKMSSNKISIEKLNSMPVLMGERDVIKMIQLLPGVQSGSEGSSGLYVRGGGPDQNLLLLDGVPVYNVNHLFGFLSTINGDAIKSAEIIKGGFPARYGGRLSSILDIRMKEGDMEAFHGDIGVGLISGKINVEGPIVKNKTSFHLSGRRTWIDAFATPIQKSIKRPHGGSEFTAYNFYDLNAKINHKFSDKSRLFFSSYIGDDNFRADFKEPKFEEVGKLKWGNKIFSLRWNYQLNPKLFSNTTLYNSAYDFSFFLDEKVDILNGIPSSTGSFTSDSKIRDYGGKVDFNFLPNPNFQIRFGVGNVFHVFTPTVNKETTKEGTNPPVVSEKGTNKVEANDITAYVENELSIGSKINVNLGLHFANFSVQNSNYSSLQPRASLSFLLNKTSSVKLSYSKMTQFLHLLSSPGLGLPTDLWVPSTDKIKPENSIQYALGYTKSLGNGYELTLEGYYKTLDNLLEYKSGFNIFSTSSGWEEKVFVGTGKTYGIEVLFEKRKGKTTGWIGYTFAKSDRSFPDINEGKAFPYKYDRRHDISLAVIHKKNERLDFGLVWVYGSGNTYTLGTTSYDGINAGTEPVFAGGFLSSFLPVNHLESRNNQRAPAYHRLDLSVNFHKEKKRGKRTWSFGVYNAYSRQNPFAIDLKQRKNGQHYLQQTSLLPIIPFATYSFKF